ncbi:MAG: helix-turn-helix domain-containing protein [Amylibacter sp.]|nr:helix-turn-helix domain-containing protein [Amylibacter sp.]
MDTIARTPEDIGTALRNARKAARLTQKGLADRSGIWQETISKIETGTGSAKLDTIFDLCAALDLELHVSPRSKGANIALEDIL